MIMEFGGGEVKGMNKLMLTEAWTVMIPLSTR